MVSNRKSLVEFTEKYPSFPLEYDRQRARSDSRFGPGPATEDYVPGLKELLHTSSTMATAFTKAAYIATVPLSPRGRSSRTIRRDSGRE